jgi:hypothetical protein
MIEQANNLKTYQTLNEENDTYLQRPGPLKRSASLKAKSTELLKANHNHPNPHLKSNQNHYRLNLGDIPFVVGKVYFSF